MISTKIVKIDPVNPEEKYLKEAAAILENGGLVIMPTETVYGIGANMLNKQTQDRLYDIKKRPKDKPFSLHIDEKENIEDFAQDIPILAYKLIDKFWPGPLTIILKAKDRLKFWSQDTVGLRMPDNEIALRLISHAQIPIVCPSANISGKPAPVDFNQALLDLKGLVDFAIDAGKTKLGVESSVVDLAFKPFRILREAAIKKENIEEIARKKTVLFVCTGNSCRSVMAKALLEKRLKEQGRPEGIEILSSGIMMLSGMGASDETRELLRREGIDVSAHRSQRVTKGVIKKSDIILVMERGHEDKVLELAPEAKNRLFLLKEFAKIGDNNLDIADPIGRPIQFYEETFKVIKEAVGRIVEII